MMGKTLLLLPVLVAFSAAQAIAGDVVEVGIVRMQFDPQQVKIKPGTAVKWVNHEKRANHSIFFEDEAGQVSDRIFPGESWQRIFDRPGVYRYHCDPHPEMTGVVEVVE